MHSKLDGMPEMTDKLHSRCFEEKQHVSNF